MAFFIIGEKEDIIKAPLFWLNTDERGAIDEYTYSSHQL